MTGANGRAPIERILKGASLFGKGETTEDTLSRSVNSYESGKCKKTLAKWRF